MSEELWAEMVAFADSKGWKKGDYKNLNLPFENKLLAQAKEVRERMAKRVEDFAYKLINDVFNAADTAPLAIDAILKAGSHDPGPKGKKIEDPAQWTKEMLPKQAQGLSRDKGPAGNFED